MKDDIIKVENFSVVDDSEKASYDIQVATAKRYPRNIEKAKINSIAMATATKEIAESCGYALPRSGRTISGPSVHLARIIAQNWGNLRVESRIKEIRHSQIVSEAVCFDLEMNYAVKVEVIRSILDKNRKRYNEDMITVTGNAANSISYRNAVFAVVNKGIVDAVYNETRKILTKDISNKDKLTKRRDDALKLFKDAYGASQEDILNLLELKSIDQINQEHLITLIGVIQSIKDGDSKPSDLFPKKTVEQKKEAMKVSQTKMQMP